MLSFALTGFECATTMSLLIGRVRRIIAVAVTWQKRSCTHRIHTALSCVMCADPVRNGGRNIRHRRPRIALTLVDDSSRARREILPSAQFEFCPGGWLDMSRMVIQRSPDISLASLEALPFRLLGGTIRPDSAPSLRSCGLGDRMNVATSVCWPKASASAVQSAKSGVGSKRKCLTHLQSVARDPKPKFSLVSGSDIMMRPIGRDLSIARLAIKQTTQRAPGRGRTGNRNCRKHYERAALVDRFRNHGVSNQGQHRATR